jgi:iron complex transport system ATP-binding protein
VWEDAVEGPRFLVLDEPTSSFDLAHQHLTLDVVRNLAAKGVGILMVVHDLNLAVRCADLMVLMQGGRIVHAGVPEEVLTREHITEVFQVETQIGTHPLSGKPLVIT